MSKVSKRKGLSIEEKVTRIETWFVSHPTPYTLKDLMAILPRETGVVPQSVEECLEVLVSENAVRQKKVGIHVLFWRFPKTATQQLAASIAGDKGGCGIGGTTEVSKYVGMSVAQIQAELDTLTKKEAEVLQRIQEARAAVGEEASVRHDAEAMRQLQNEMKTLQLQLQQVALLDPLMLEKIKAATRVALEAANRWTDNLCLLEHHVSQRMGLSAQELRAQLQLPQDVDYIEYDDLAPCGNTDVKGAAASAPETLPSSSSPPNAAKVVSGDVFVSAALVTSPTDNDVDPPAALDVTQTPQKAGEKDGTQPICCRTQDASTDARNRKQAKKKKRE